MADLLLIILTKPDMNYFLLHKRRAVCHFVCFWFLSTKLEREKLQKLSKFIFTDLMEMEDRSVVKLSYQNIGCKVCIYGNCRN
jgi:hypothetical protein